MFTPTEILALLSQGQSETLHWFPEDVSLSRLATTLVGMANTSGGVALIGIAPRSGEIQGVRDQAEAVDRVFQAALLADPPLVLPLPVNVAVQIPQHPIPLNVLCIQVPPGLPHVYSLEGRYFGCEGSQTNPLSARRLRQLLLERGIVQFEALIPPEATPEDLDPQKVTAYLDALHLPGNEPPEETLLRRGCLKSASEGKGSQRNTPFCPTYAALLLFGRHPQRWLPNATILAARFSGAVMSDQFVKQDISGTLPEQLRLVETFVRDHLRSTVQMAGLEHRETLEYPLEAVRELIVNAVAHRDYNQQGDTIHLHIFADRLEIYSPGGLPGPVTLNNLLEARFSRNAVIVQILSDLGFVERLGYGLDRVVAVLSQHNLPPPRFEEIAGSFRVTLFRPANTPPAYSPSAYSPSVNVPSVIRATAPASALPADLNPRQQAVLAYLGVQARITNSQYQELCPDVHPETLRRDLADLVSRGLLIKVGDKKATYYILK